MIPIRRAARPTASWARICNTYSRHTNPALRPAVSFSLQSRTLKTSRSKQQQDVFHSQAEDPNNEALLSSFKKPKSTPQTLTEKIFQRHALDLSEGKTVLAGDFITLSPAHCMTHDNSWPVATKFMDMGAINVHNKDQLVMTLDHDVQNRSESNLKKYRQIEEFAKQQGVQFYPAGHGIGHQIVVEEGFAWPGTAVVASDSHTNMYGGVGCLGTPVVRTGAADIWATGTTWMKIPPIAKVTFLGQLPRGATGKDVIVALCGLFHNDEVLNHAIEFTGSAETMASLPVDDRLAIANMTTEWGALSGLFPVDQTLKDWFRLKATEAQMYDVAGLTDASNGRSSRSSRINHPGLDDLFSERNVDRLRPDPGARYTKSLFLDLSTVSPYVSGPNSVKIATPVQDLQNQNIRINKAYLVSCTNSRSSDLAAAARVFREAADRGDRATIADGVQLYVAAASKAEQQAAEATGDWGVLLQAGATPLPSGCGPCIGLGTGLLEPGEVGISASNRNFKGRMGSTDAKAYLASPEVVAASALNGIISSTGWYQQPHGHEGILAGEGDGIQRRVVGVEEALEKWLDQADDMIAAAEAKENPTLAGAASTESSTSPSTAQPTRAATEAISAPTTDVIPNFPTTIKGEILFCDADNINTDGIYPGKYTYQDAITPEVMASVCMQNYDPSFASLSSAGDILVSGFNFGCGSSREQAATAILAAEIPLVVAGSFGNIFATNSVNNALMGLEVPRLVRRLRETFSGQTEHAPAKAQMEPGENAQSLDSVVPTPVKQEGGKVATRRTGWTLEWDVGRSVVRVTEGDKGVTWEEKVPEIPRNVQYIIAGGGLVKTRQREFGKLKE